jgi:hypothetical protein
MDYIAANRRVTTDAGRAADSAELQAVTQQRAPFDVHCVAFRIRVVGI